MNAHRYSAVICLSSAICAVAFPTAASAQLINGSFDVGGGSLTGWQTFNDPIANVSAASVTPYDGTHVAKVFGGFNGDPNFSGMLQNLPASPGQTWTAGAHVRHNSNDSLAGTGNMLSLKIEFYRVAGGAYGTSDMLLESSTIVLNGSSAEDIWAEHQHAAVAPDDTVEARLAFVLTQTGSANGAALVDGVTFVPDDGGEDPPGMVLAWQDEFDGSSLNPDNWEIMIGDGTAYGLPAGWGNNELQYYRADNITVSGGMLQIEARDDGFAGYDYTSARIRTATLQDFLYGRMEGRIKLPSGQGFWPAFWMMPTGFLYGGWAASGELDIVEAVNIPTTVHGTIHFGGSWPNNTSAGGSIGGADYSADFHVYAVEWEPDQIRWYVDDQLYHVETSQGWFSSGAPGNPRAPFDQLFHFLLNVAVGGNWPGPPNGSTPFPQQMLVDWVRVYQFDEVGDPLLQIADTTPAGAQTDGTVEPAEYVGSAAGINTGAGDRVGQNSTLHIDSGADGSLSLAIESADMWPFPSSWGVVIYIDSQPDGYGSTSSFVDDSGVAQRLASAVGLAGQRADLFFALGFGADYALCLEADQATILALGTGEHTVINGADLGAATDMFGGTQVAYRSLDGQPDSTTRELRLRLEHIGLLPGDSFDLFGTHLIGNSAFRSNEFVGVAAGNPWDGGASDNIGVTTAALKIGDWIRFTTATAAECFVDGDGDGYGSTTSVPSEDGACTDADEAVVDTDCDDQDPDAFPGAPEMADDGTDQDCNGFDTVTCFADQDGDGVGSAVTLLADDGDCADSGESTVDTDCDDADPSEFPGQVWFADCDGDGDPRDTAVSACDAEAAEVLSPCDDLSAPDGGWSHTAGTDCDDEDAANYPGNTELCDGQDNNCDLQTDEPPACVPQCPGGTVAECADIDEDGIRDDGCVFWECIAGLCSDTAVVFADMGGTNGACVPDGAADGNDRFHALNCFSDQTTQGLPGYLCEAAPPEAYNVDAAGLGTPCLPDGVCDGNDAFAALNAFDGSSTCACPGRPSPTLPATSPAIGRVGLRLRPRSARIAAGGTVAIEVWLDGPVKDLRGYQLEVATRGGSAGRLELADLTIEARKDQAFAGLPMWSAFNLHTRQLVTGLDGLGVAVGARHGYLATLTLQATAGAAGRFTVDLRLRSNAGRTWLFASRPGQHIEVDSLEPATITVHSARPSARRR